MNLHTHLTIMVTLVALLSTAVPATPFDFSTGVPDGLIATGSRPDSPGQIEIESADDFLLTRPTLIDHATFTGLITGGASPANIGQVVVEIYRVFPNDSDTSRTVNVPTRVNSPSILRRLHSGYIGDYVTSFRVGAAALLVAPTLPSLR